MGRRARGTRCFTGVAAGLLLLTGTPAGAAPLGHVGRNVNISRMFGNQNETAVAISPTNPKNIVVTSNLESFRGLLEAYSFDGGLTWTRHTIADGSDDLGLACCDSSLAFDSYGNLFLTYLLVFDIKVPVALSTDGGVNFERLDQILPKATGGHPLHSRGRVSAPDQPTIATGPGSVWVTYTGGTAIEAAGAAVSGLGVVRPFRDPEVALGHRDGHFGDIAVGPGGQVLVVYQTVSGEAPSEIITDLDPDGLGPLGFDRARLAALTNVGDFDVIPAAARVTIDAETGLAWDRSGGPNDGRVFLVWTQETPDESDDTEILVQYSDDDGDTWSDPLRVNDDPGTNSQFMPKIALDQTTGNLALAWYDCRFDLGAGGPGDTNGIPNDDALLHASVSTDGGASFARNFRVAARVSNSEDAGTTQDFGDYEGLAFESGSFYPVWADNSNSTGDNPNGTLHELDLYTARVTVA
jgi:hypothetical protein